MIKEIQPFSYSGSIKAPCSKSYMQRAIAIACMGQGESRIFGFTKSEDVDVAINIAKELGAEIKFEDSTLFVQGVAKNKDEIVSINCGEAGLSTRMFSAVSAALYQNVKVNGSGSILTRPMDMVIDALTQLGATVDSSNQLLPLTIKGGLHSAEIEIDGSESSQLLTGLLIALPTLSGNSVVNVKNLKSRPYIDMTLEILNEFGIKIENRAYETFIINGNQKANGIEYHCEGDWSGAAFHLVGAAVSGSIELLGLNANSSQADIAILTTLKLAGANVEVNADSIKVSKDKLNCFEFDATQCPDLFPPIAALAACCDGTSTIYGVERLIHKESNRALTIQTEMAKLGIKVTIDGNAMRIKGGLISGNAISSNNDHRIAMMGAVLASVSSQSITISNSEAISKSYPGFYLDLPK
ncbi:MAG: 3-phosphoshikimate 1-carboxyvinyltransferase [Crocinitomicaceae bacterium]|jgi:3-phosphoshikimate 1-carboxyvinyltransferase